MAGIIASGMAKPTVLHNLRLKRLCRYLAKYPTETWVFEHQDEPKEILGCTRSQTGVVPRKPKVDELLIAIRLGSHLLDTSCGKQIDYTVALTRGSAATIMVQNILAQMDRKYKLACLTDSSAAKGISHRRGVGRVKHFELEELWVQDKVDKAELEVRKIGTDKNWSDNG